MSVDPGPTQSSPWPSWPEDFAESAEDQRALLVLSALRGITPRRLLDLGVLRGSASSTLAWIREGRAGSEGDQAFARSLDGDRIAAAARAFGARFVTWSSSDYPWQLRQIHDPPAAFYLIGRPPPDLVSAVAVVGARRCSPLGRETANALGRELGRAGVTVVSGAARGVDSSAHEGALTSPASTLAVLGSGLDVRYPSASRALIARIGQQGTLMSEYAPGIPPSPRHFPARNRIVAGLCRATVVVEGATGSGSMITAEHAMEFGRDVFAVPGSITSKLSEVPLQLIREGATVIRGADDLLEDLGIEPLQTRIAEQLDLHGVEWRILDRIIGPMLPDRLADELGLSMHEVMGFLMRLELRGLVRNVGGRYDTTLAAGSVQRGEASRRSARGTPEPATSRTGTAARSSRLAAIDAR